jgi:hypothetical protein
MITDNLKLYKVLTYILLPIGYLFGFIDVLFLMSALANPATLIFVFVIACLVIYILTSFKFYKQGILNEQILKGKLKDWIKVNAYVSLFLCSLFFLNSISILISSNAVLYKFIDDLISQQSNFPREANPALILSILKIVATFLFISSAVALLHIRITLKLVKENGHLFENK